MAIASFVQVPAAETDCGKCRWAELPPNYHWTALCATVATRAGPSCRVHLPPPGFHSPGAAMRGGGRATNPNHRGPMELPRHPLHPQSSRIRDSSPDRAALGHCEQSRCLRSGMERAAIGDGAGSDQRVGSHLNGQPTLDPFEVLHGGRRELSNIDASSVFVPCLADAPAHPVMDSTGHADEITSDATIVVVLNLHRHDVKHDTPPCLYRCLRRRISRLGC